MTSCFVTTKLRFFCRPNSPRFGGVFFDARLATAHNEIHTSPEADGGY